MLVLVFLASMLTAYLLFGVLIARTADKVIQNALGRSHTSVAPDKMEAVNKLRKQLKRPFLSWRLPDEYAKGTQARLFCIIALPLIMLGIFGPDIVIMGMLGFNLGSALRAVHTIAALQFGVKRMEQEHPDWYHKPK